MRAYLYGLIINLQFFSTIPIHMEVQMTKKNMERAIQLFPVLGLLQGLVYIGLLSTFIQFSPFSPLAIAFLLWIALILLTGGIHLDGWIDSSDAFFSYKDKEERLQIMEDPRVGAFGVIGIIVLLSAKFLFIYEIILLIEPSSYSLILLIPVLSKILMGFMLGTVKPAKEKGLGYMFRNARGRFTLWIYLIYVGLILISFMLWQRTNLIIVCIMLSVTLLIFLVLRKKIIKWFGGITGDVVGASTEGMEVCLWMIVWLFHYYVMG